MADKPKKSLVEKYAGSRVPPAGTTPLPSESDSEEIEQSPQDDPDPFSERNLAKKHQQIMLELRKLNGNRKALGYSYLLGIDFDPSTGLLLEFTGYLVAITGHNLDRLYAGLVIHKIGSIRETDPRREPPDGAAVIDSITIRRAGAEEEKP